MCATAKNAFAFNTFELRIEFEIHRCSSLSCFNVTALKFLITAFKSSFQRHTLRMKALKYNVILEQPLSIKCFAL